MFLSTQSQSQSQDIDEIIKIDGMGSNKKRYREIITALNRALDVTEVKMCSKRFSSINMSGVPSRCMTRNQAAFSNELLPTSEWAGSHNTMNPETGNRFPDDPDRVQCRKNLLKTLSPKGQGVKGAQLYPHEYVEQVLSTGNLSSTKELVLNSQWTSMRESIVEMVKKRTDSVHITEKSSDSPTDVSSTNTLTLGNSIPLSDVSGSMSGTPMMVSIGLGILCSELAHESFRDLVMTFSGLASWECLKDCHSFVDKVKKLRSAHWEGSTEFL